ncbi:MAG: DNA polymerase III subunit delta, partial [Prevotella sp.]|nr:DNA polymerase III subunit delta [Prevotella sp.]
MTSTFEKIKADITGRNYSPVYLFMGDEPYYIDELTNLLIETVIPDAEKDFNQHILYGLETDVASVITLARSFPMMSDYQLLVVKEAQNLKKIEELEVYFKNPQKTTVLVLNYKGGSLDKRKKLYAAIDRCGVVLEAKKIYENKIPSFVQSYFKQRKFGIDDKATQMLADFLGNDLSKLVNEMDKLLLSLPANEKRITAELIERNIGISKDYNNFELLKAVAEKNVLKANRIVDYFAKNPKNNPLIVTFVVLFNFFSNLLICCWENDKSEYGIAAALGFRQTFQAKDYVMALSNYGGTKTMEIIGLLRQYDAKAKGVDNVSTPQGELLKEL